MRIETRPPFDYGSIDVGYYDRVYHRRVGIQSAWHRLKFDHIRRHLSPACSHLDIGCGPGTFIGTLDASIQSVGVDVALPQVLYARAHYGTPQRRFEVVQGDRLPFADETFDAVTCIELVEHLSTERNLSLLAETKRVLKPGGSLLVTTPDYGGLWPVLEWLLNRLGDVSYEDQHITHFTRARLAALLRDSGFDDVRVERFQFIAPFAAALGRGVAALVGRWEPRFLTSRFGFLLLGLSRAPR